MTLWIDALNKLRSLGYEISFNEGRLTYAYYSKDSPLPGQIVPLIEVLKVHKGEIINDPQFLIDQTLREINNTWTPGTFEWMKRSRPSEFEKMVALEEEINRIVIEANAKELVEVLRNYKELMLNVVKAFKAPKGKTGDLFQYRLDDR